MSCVTAPAGHANKTRSRFLCNGRERPHELFGRMKAEKVGSLQPNSVPFRGHFAHSVVRNSLLLGHLLARQVEREGDGQGEQTLSCTVYLPALQIAIEAHRKYSSPTPLRGLEIGKAQ